MVDACCFVFVGCYVWRVGSCLLLAVCCVVCCSVRIGCWLLLVVCHVLCGVCSLSFVVCIL